MSRHPPLPARDALYIPRQAGGLDNVQSMLKKTVTLRFPWLMQPLITALEGLSLQGALHQRSMPGLQDYCNWLLVIWHTSWLVLVLASSY